MEVDEKRNLRWKMMVYLSYCRCLTLSTKEVSTSKSNPQGFSHSVECVYLSDDVLYCSYSGNSECK